MTATKTIDIKNFCNTIDNELSGMRSKLLKIVSDIQSYQGEQNELLRSHVPHFEELVKAIEWKRDIFLKACPFEFHKHDTDLEGRPSVPASEDPEEAGKRTSGGYVGG